MLKTNVIKKEYEVKIRNIETGEKKRITICAESIPSAVLKIPDGWMPDGMGFMEEKRREK